MNAAGNVRLRLPGSAAGAGRFFEMKGCSSQGLESDFLQTSLVVVCDLLSGILT